MKITPVEDENGCRSLAVEAGWSAIAADYDDIVAAYSRVQIPGFRPGKVPQDFLRVSVPLVIGTGLAIGLLFFAILMFAIRALKRPVSSGAESFVGKTGTATSWREAEGQVQLQSELWTAEKADESDEISKGDKVEVVQVKGLRLKVRKIQ